MAVINNLKDKDLSQYILEVAFGRHTVAGDLCWSYATGTGATLRNFGYVALGEGEWDGIESGFYLGEELAATEYSFHSGALAIGMDEGEQTVDPWFLLDVPHSRTAAISFRTAEGVGELDTEKNPPNKFKGIFRTKKAGNFNNLGVQTDFSYSANPARVLAECFYGYARIPNLPSIYTDYLDYWKKRIDWGAFVEWRDFCGGQETVDYREIEDLQGFGLTATWYNGSSFNTEISKRVDPIINYPSSIAALAPGLTPALFSAKFEGFVKPQYSQTYTFSLTHEEGARVYIDNVLIVNGWATTGVTETGTVALTAGQFHAIRVEWFNTSGAANIKLEWESTSRAKEVVPSERLYPKVETRPRYETHVVFKRGTGFNEAMGDILFMSNSVRQDVNGKLRFFCLEQITPVFEFNSSNIIEGTFAFESKNVLKVDPITEYEATFLDLDSRFLAQPTTPISYSIDPIAAINKKKILTLSNTTRWQALKILQHRAKLEIMRGISGTFDSPAALSYQPLQGSLVTIDHRKIGVPKTFLVVDAVSKSGGDKNIPKRTFRVQEWN